MLAVQFFFKIQKMFHIFKIQNNFKYLQNAKKRFYIFKIQKFFIYSQNAKEIYLCFRKSLTVTFPYFRAISL